MSENTEFYVEKRLEKMQIVLIKVLYIQYVAHSVSPVNSHAIESR